MIKYFGKSGLKQSMRNKPIRFGFKVWVMATVSGYVVSFELYQGKGVGASSSANVQAVGAAASTVLDLLDLLPMEKMQLPYHIFADNFFSSHKLIDVLAERGIEYTGTIRNDRLKGGPALTPVEKFKKKERGYHETIALKDGSQIVTRWNDNSPVTLISSVLGDQPMATALRFSRSTDKYVDVRQPDVVKKYNLHMGGVDRFDQNNNHLRIEIGGKKWYWPVVTWLIDTGVQNAWQLHRKAGGKLSLLSFKREVVCTILRSAAASRGNSTSFGAQAGPIGNRPGDDIRYDRIDHLPGKRPLRRQCCMEGCRSKVRTICIKCGRYLCLDCFASYHTRS